MTCRAARRADLEWIVDVLAVRREAIVQNAPIFWRPAPDARTKHRAFVEFLLTEDDARIYRTDTSVLIATRRAEGWLVDDAFVPGEQWADRDGGELWNAFAAECGGAPVRFVCPTYETERVDFACAAGLAVDESWWLFEPAGAGGGAPGTAVELPGADAVVVGAPPVYAPPGPVLFLPVTTDARQAIPVVVRKARGVGCAAVVVNQKVSDTALALDLTASGFRRHCDYYVGAVRAM